MNRGRNRRGPAQKGCAEEATPCFSAEAQGIISSHARDNQPAALWLERAHQPQSSIEDSGSQALHAGDFKAGCRGRSTRPPELLSLGARVLAQGYLNRVAMPLLSEIGSFPGGCASSPTLPPRCSCPAASTTSWSTRPLATGPPSASPARITRSRVSWTGGGCLRRCRAVLRSIGGPMSRVAILGRWPRARRPKFRNGCRAACPS